MNKHSETTRSRVRMSQRTGVATGRSTPALSHASVLDSIENRDERLALVRSLLPEARPLHRLCDSGARALDQLLMAVGRPWTLEVLEVGVK